MKTKRAPITPDTGTAAAAPAPVAQHTPEPWIIRAGDIYGADGIQVAITNHRQMAIGEKGEEEEANAARLVACVNACAGMTDPAAEVAQLRVALAHALAFIEHSHQNFDDPITEIDSFTSSSDGGPEMECNLKMMRDALKR